VLFVQDYKNEYLRFDYDEIWLVLCNEYKLDHIDIRLLIKNILLVVDKKLMRLLPMRLISNKHSNIIDVYKLKML
jgi:hypothetical protein